MYLRLGRKTYLQSIQYFNTSIYQQLLNRDRKANENMQSVQNTQQTTSKIYQIGNQKDRMSIHSNEPSSPLSKQVIVSCQQLLLWSVENTNFKNSKSQYTQEHEKSQTEHCQSRIRDVDEDPN